MSGSVRQAALTPQKSTEMPSKYIFAIASREKLLGNSDIAIVDSDSHSSEIAVFFGFSFAPTRNAM